MSGGCEILKAQVSKTYSLMSTDYFGMCVDTDFLSFFLKKSLWKFCYESSQTLQSKNVKSSLIIVSEATTGSFFAIKSWFWVRPSQSVNFSQKKPKVGRVIDKKLTKIVTFYYFYCKKLARNL